MLKKILFFTFYFIIIGESLMAKNSLPKYYEDTLTNGLKVIAIPLKNNSDVITTDIFYNVGSRDEVMGKSGIAHMLEHLNFKSTKNLKAGEFDNIVKGFGGVNNASTGFDYTHYYIKSSKKNLSKSLELYADLMENLTLKDEEFQPERDVVAEERRWRTDNSPMGYLYFKLFNNTFTYHPYHWTPIGFMNDIQNWKIEDIRDFHSKYYTPSNAIVVVAGDIEKDEVFKEVKKQFNSIKNTKNSKSILKEVVHQYVPIEMLDRPKSGFSIPLTSWFLGDLNQLLMDTLSKQQIDQFGILNYNSIANILADFNSGKLHYKPLIWKLLMFQMWNKFPDFLH